MEQKYCVYCHTNRLNGKKYIGQTKSGNMNRWKNPISSYHHNSHFISAIRKYGWANFEHLILEDDLTKNEADYFEEKYILDFNTLDRQFGYNLKHGGSHGALSEETKQKISKTHTGQKRSEEARNHMSEAQKKIDHPKWTTRGKHFTDEAKKHLSEAHKGKKPILTKEQQLHKSEAIKKALAGKIYITNGIETKKILLDQLVEYEQFGWYRGRTVHYYDRHCWNRGKKGLIPWNKGKHNVQTVWNKGKHGERIWVNNGLVSKMIPKEKMDEYIGLGFVKGRKCYSKGKGGLVDVNT